jgi:glycosyltransferase involved in cell wall biosynthesis
MPKVSVIIPTYNRAYVVREAVKSILSQTFDDLEVIVVDDGSTDDTRSVVEAIDDARVKYYYKENGGCSSARNLGSVKSTGEYIGFLDSDDLWPDNFLEVMLQKLQENPQCGVAYCATTFVHSTGPQVESYKVKRCVSGWITKELFKNSFIWPSTVLIYKGVLNNFYFDEALRNSEDTDAFLRLSTKTQFIFVSGVEVIRRHSLDSPTRKSFVDVACNRALSLERFYFRLGGNKLVPAKLARKKISHVYRRAAERNRYIHNRTAAICLYKRAISYWPFDIRLYWNLLHAYLLSREKDTMPDWKMPQPLPNSTGPAIPT